MEREAFSMHIPAESQRILLHSKCLAVFNSGEQGGQRSIEMCALPLGTQTFTLCVGKTSQACAAYFLKVLVGAFGVEKVEN